MTKTIPRIHHDKRRRYRDTTREEKDDETTKMTNIRSIAVPWAAMVIASVFAAAYVSYTIRTDEEIDPYTYFEESEKERFLADELSTEHHHVHKPVYEEYHASLFPLSTSDRVGFFLAICGLMLAAGGGIGGGGILVPIYILVMGFSPKHGIPLSNVTVFGGAIANMILNAQKRHPIADRPLIDWDLILVMEPLTIAGALIGAFLNKILHEQLLTFMLVLLLSFTAYNSLRKAIKMYNIESRMLRKQGLKPDGTKRSELSHLDQKEEEEGLNQAGDELLEDMDLQEGENPGSGDLDVLPGGQTDAQALQKILEEERVTPMFNVRVLVGLFIVVLVMNLLKGGGAFPSPIGIKCGSQEFWIANAIIMGWIILISIYIRNYLVKRNDLKERIGYKTVEGDIKWDARATILYPSICCLAGFFAGMFGIGGGIVKGPLMLAMEVHPGVASASSACMILFTSFTATTSFFVFGLLDPQYGPICFSIGFISTYFGQIGLSILMKKYQRNSYIAFSMGAVVLLSAIMMTVQSLLSIAEGEYHKSGGIC
mmetsp:Transcript_14885/g.31834  ORF Transcript_14885/g.31834 Transcript_14885/m.31834 type:complete len:541 (-) Transcript_14885:413-2035(-)|eukprot:CAMPEP_0168182818 /NCGR_PEP_ID=MMETSP0139_2-20121125/12095_1 /TAXON_ID=44445 /ORGANISM="Pseudo-nitzschia australis, Strain 10249 10 AB" /LENGTH=540 /DNA_ID=CAMNT_0008103771 /DNA_START=103 /DNA_END=1725 /DNA_ORIENTATION=-